MSSRLRDRLAAASIAALAALVIAPYLLGWSGAALRPWLTGVLALALAADVFRRVGTDADGPAEADGAWSCAMWLAVVAGVATWLVWASWPLLLPPGGGSDLTHHLVLVDVLARTRHLVDGDAMVGALGEMAHYTPGLHLAIVTVGELVGVAPWRAAHPVMIATVALKAGFVFLIALRLLTGVRARVPLALSAVAFVLFMPRVYSVGGFLQSGYLAQVAAEVFVVAGWWALGAWHERPRRIWLALLGACGAATFLVWPIWIGPLLLATAIVVATRAGLSVGERARALLYAVAPVVLVAVLHLSRHAAYLRMAGTSGAVPAFVPDGAWWVLVVLATAGFVSWAREPRARVTVAFAGALALQAAALVALARSRGAETPYMAVKMTYLAAYPLAVLAAAGFGRTAATLSARVASMAGWARAGIVGLVAVRLAAGFALPPAIVSPDLAAAGEWARAHVQPDCVDYVVPNGDTAYWLHLAVMGNPRDAARISELDHYALNAAVGRWIDGSSRPYAIAGRALLPAEVRGETEAVFSAGDAVVIARRGAAADATCRR